MLDLDGISRTMIDRLHEIDPVALWARSTEREMQEEPFQRDEDFLRTLLPWMDVWSRYFDGEVRGFEHVPADGPMLLVGNHSGGVLVPDTGVFFASWYRQRGLDSPLVGLAFDAAFGLPWFGTLMRKIGEVPASRENAQRALRAGAAVLVYPGGDHEAFRPWSDRNRVDFAGRSGFIQMALREQVPVVPVISHGGHHTTVILTRGEWIGRLLGTDRIRTTTFPVALQIPWGLSVLSTPGMPLPAKITMQLCPPMPWSQYGADAADDPAIVQRCYHEITGLMQAQLDALVAEHPHPVLANLRRLLPWGRDGGGRR